MRWKWSAGEEELGEELSSDVLRQDRIQADLEARGVPPRYAELLAERIDATVDERDARSFESLLDGVSLACRVQRDLSEELANTARDLGEIERPMSAFAGELAKLDAVVEVRAAYLRRMRTTSPSVGTRVLQ